MLPVEFVGASPDNYVPGRGAGCPITAIYLHVLSSDLLTLDSLACRKRPTPNAPGTSYHYAVELNKIHQYVATSDTAITFGTSTAVPAVPGPVVGCTADQQTINIAVLGAYLGGQAPDCSDVKFDQASIELAGKLICKLSQDLGLTVDATTILVAGGSSDFPVSQVIDAARECLAAPVILNPVNVLGGCLAGHGTSTNLNIPLTAWNGNCLVEILVPKPVTLCNYGVNIAFTDDGTDFVNSITFNSTVYTPSAPIELEFPNTPALQLWLNSLGLGTWVVNFISGTAGGATTINVGLLASALPANSIQIAAPAISNPPFIQFGCVTVTQPQPLLISDIYP